MEDKEGLYQVSTTIEYVDKKVEKVEGIREKHPVRAFMNLDNAEKCRANIYERAQTEMGTEMWKYWMYKFECAGYKLVKEIK